MTTQVEETLRSFDLLPERDKRECVGELLRRSMTLDAPPMCDASRVDAAEELFPHFDRDEAGNA